jgi:RimJ/RimL family protein N-acetyltransferase
MTPLHLETPRLLIRSFQPDDAVTIQRIMAQAFGDGSKVGDETELAENREYIEWNRLNHIWFPKIEQFPYGDRAVVLKENNTLIGSVGLVALIDAFPQIPELGYADTKYSTAEVGLFWVIAPQYQKQGYATEAAQAVIDYAFNQLRLNRILATTAYTNTASQQVMEKLGMQLTKNPRPEPEHLQVVGILENTK